MIRLWRVATSGLRAGSRGRGGGISLGAVQVVELSAEYGLSGSVVTVRVAMTGREAATESHLEPMT